MRRRKQSPKEVLLILGVLVIAAVAVFFGSRWLEDSTRKPETRGDISEHTDSRETIEVGGHAYKPKSGIVTMLIMGIDRDSDASESGFRSGGQADFLELLVMDTIGKKVTRLSIDRDTMTPITILSVLGKKNGTRTAQICLSHSFGDGKAQSCEHTVEAVSGLLLGVEINDYVAMNLDGINTLNDLVGGVTVTVEDDFSHIDPVMTPGTTLTLQGQQAEIYVRSRMHVGVGTNASRMARQKVYMNGLIDNLHRKMENESFAATLYDAMLPYLQSSMNRGLLINRMWALKNYSVETVELPGEHCVGSDGFMEFHADENSLKEIVLGLFYTKLK